MDGAGFKLSVLSLATATVVACGGAGDWVRTYTEGADYSLLEDVYVARANQIIVTGRRGPQSAFVAAYNTAGELLWDQSSAEPNFTYYPTSQNAVLQDSLGNLYVSRMEGLKGDSPTLAIYKYSSQGELLTYWSTGIGDFPSLSYKGFQISGSKLYVSSASMNAVEVYDLQGGLLWSYQLEATGASMGFDPDALQEYDPQADLSTSDQTAVTGPATITKLVQGPLLLNQNSILLVTDKLVELDSNGAEVRTLSANDLGLQSLFNGFITQGNLVIFGRTASGVKSVVINDTFNVVSSSELAQPISQFGSMASSGEVICAGASNAANSYRLISLSASGNVLWDSPISVEGSVEYSVVKASAAGCLLQLSITAKDGTLTSEVMRFDGDGNVAAMVSYADFAPFDLEVSGNVVYQAGISGEYDGSVTLGTLVKQNF